jgi:hypothetical protein
MLEHVRHEDEADEAVETSRRLCDHEGCVDTGDFRAPKHRDRLDDYYWFCLTHVREYNKAWNFFAGMSDAEIQSYIRNDVTGHRPTWKLGALGGKKGWRFSMDEAKDPFDIGQEFGADAEAPRPHAPARWRSAEEIDSLAALNLGPEATGDDVKRRHKELAKRFHPDANGGDRRAEEKLKEINRAYTHLRSCGGVE